MDRVEIYPGQVPLETDLLRTNLYTMIGLGRLAMDVLGSSTAVTGLACNPTSPASMSVGIGPGALYSLQNIDNSAYSSLPADTIDQIMKQGIVKTSDNVSLAMVAPVSAGTSVIYLIEAAFSEIETDANVLPFYNSATPSVPYSGPSGTGASSTTRRAAVISIVAKPGVAASSPAAPAADAGSVPLYYVTIAYGQTSITSGNITVAPGAPFLATNLSGIGALLAGYLSAAAAASTYAPLASPALTGAPTAPTAASADNSTKIATTGWVRSAMSAIANAAGLSASLSGASGYVALPSWLGGFVVQWGSVAIPSGSNTTTVAVTLPLVFPNACKAVTVTQTTSAAAGTWHPLVCGALAQTAVGFTLQADTALGSQNIGTGVTANWVAVGC